MPGVVKKGRLSGSLVKVVIVVVLSAVALHIARSKGYDLTKPFVNAFSHYFGEAQPAPSYQPVVSQHGKPQTQSPKVVPPDAKVEEHEAKSLLPAHPRIALHPFDYSQYRQRHGDGSEMSELLASLLMIELSKSKKFDLLDRSMVSTVLEESSQLLVDYGFDSGQRTFNKLPLSDLTLTGVLFSSQEGRSYSLKLIKNSSGEILGAQRFHLDMDNMHGTVAKAENFVATSIERFRNRHGEGSNIDDDRKIAFGHFVNLNDGPDLSHGREVTEVLIDRFVNDSELSVLARTQVFPLLFEQNLRELQYIDEYGQSERPTTDYFVYGKYRLDSEGVKPLSVYLYIDLVRYGRRLMVLHPHSWGHAQQLITQSLREYLPKPGQSVPEADMEKSRQLLIDAIKERGMSFSKRLLSGERPPSRNDIESFRSFHNSERILPAQGLIEQSLAINPDNQYAKLALAMTLEREGKNEDAERILLEVRKSGTAAAEIADDILDSAAREIAANIGPEAFKGLVPPGREDAVLRALVDDGYLRDDGVRVYINHSEKLDSILNYPHAERVGDFGPDKSAAILERLRSYAFQPGRYAKNITPRSYYPDRVNEVMRRWPQIGDTRDYNAEATLQFDTASAISGMHIIKVTDIPSVDFYPEVKRQSTERRRTNLEMAIDGFASAAYLDSSYLDAMVLLGYALCDGLIGRCRSGREIHEWVVDGNEKTSLRESSESYFNTTRMKKGEDKLVFLSAEAINRVPDAALGDWFVSGLFRDDYIVEKYQDKLKKAINDVESPLSERDYERLVYAYAAVVKAQCIQLAEAPRSLRRLNRYMQVMEPLARLGSKNARAASLRGKLLREIESRYPSSYPHLLIRANPVTPSIAKEQDDMIARVASREVVPNDIMRFMESTLGQFEKRVESGATAAARRYIQYYESFYGVDADMAMDFAYLYHRVGDIGRSVKILDQYGMNVFHVSGFSREAVNGVYKNDGFDEKGRIRFSHSRNPDVYFLYHANNTRFGLGEKSIKWSLHTRDERPHRGNTNPDHRESFAFGNGGRLFGDRVWPNMSANNDEEKREETVDVDSVPVIELEAMTEDELAMPQNTFERLMKDGAFFDSRNNVAVLGNPYQDTKGPLLDEYFPPSLTKTRRISAVKKALFEKGYVSVYGMPMFEKKGLRRRRLEIDFSDYSDLERYGIEEALLATTEIEHAGTVDVYNSYNGIWEKTATVMPDDPMPRRLFGDSVAVYGDELLVCDRKDGMYSFKRVGDSWEQQYRLEVKCDDVTMNERWAAVQQREKVVVYLNNNGVWKEFQTLQAENYLEDKSQRHSFDYFGDAIAIWKDTIFIGNPFGGKMGRGQIYAYSSHGRWKQTIKLLSYQNGSAFGRSFAVNDDYLFIGNPSDGGRDSRDGKTLSPTWLSGAVLVYRRTNSGLVPRARLVVKDRPRQAELGHGLSLKKGDNVQLVVQSLKEVFRIDYADLLERIEQLETAR